MILVPSGAYVSTTARVLVVLLCSEISFRYFWWARKVAEVRNVPLRTVMLGIAVWGTGIALWSLYAITFGALFVDPAQRPWVLATMAAIIGGALCFLVPCWRISCGFGSWRIIVECTWRFALAITLALAHVAIFKELI